MKKSINFNAILTNSLHHKDIGIQFIPFTDKMYQKQFLTDNWGDVPYVVLSMSMFLFEIHQALIYVQWKLSAGSNYMRLGNRLFSTGPPKIFITLNFLQF